MQSLGIAVALPTPGRPVVRAVLLEDALGSTEVPQLSDVSVVDEFEFTTTEEDWAHICRQYHRDTDARVSSLAPDAVIVRRADFHRDRGNNDGPRLRLIVEGAVTAAATAHVANTHLRTGAACAERYGSSKVAMDADGRGLASKAIWKEAAGAALSGLVANRV